VIAGGTLAGIGAALSTTLYSPLCLVLGAAAARSAAAG
jgi:hypothetical protein